MRFFAITNLQRLSRQRKKFFFHRSVSKNDTIAKVDRETPIPKKMKLFVTNETKNRHVFITSISFHGISLSFNLTLSIIASVQNRDVLGFVKHLFMAFMKIHDTIISILCAGCILKNGGPTHVLIKMDVLLKSLVGNNMIWK